MPGKDKKLDIFEGDLTQEAVLVEHRKLLSINQNELHVAILEQPELHYRVGHHYSIALSRRDEAKEDLADMDAELSAHFRVTLFNDGKRPTNDAVSEAVQQHKDHARHFGAYNDATLHAALLGSLKSSVEQRSYMLKEMVALYVTGYFANQALDRNNEDVGTVVNDGLRHRQTTK